MKTLVLRSLFSLSEPLPDTPVLPEFDPSLLFSYSPGSIAVNSGKVSKWSNEQGTYGASADLSIPSPTAPARGEVGAIFSGANSTFISTAEFSTPIKVPILSVLMRLKFSAVADQTQGTLFSGTQTSGYAYLRRMTDGVISAGVNAADTMRTTEKCPVNQWVNVAVVFNGASTKIYIGDKVATGTTGMASMTGLRIGANASGVFFLNAEVSHLQGYSRSLGADEIQEIFGSLV